VDTPSFDDLFRAGRDAALGSSRRLSLEVAEREGTDVNALLAASATVGDEVVAQLASVASRLFLDTAEGADLRKYVWDRYRLKAKEASPAVGSVSFSLPSASAVAFEVPVGTTLSTPDGTKYKTTSTASFAVGAAGPVVASVVSLVAGLKQQAKAGAITSIVDPVPGAPAGLTVTNPLATAGADDEEDDASLRRRARLFWSTARRGTVAALEAGALSVPGVRTAVAHEVIDQLGRPLPYVLLAVTDAFTAQLATLDAVPAAYAAQSQVFAQTVASKLSDVRAAGAFVRVSVAKVEMLPIVLALSFAAGVNVDEVALRARAAVVSWTNARKSGETWTPAGARAVLRGVRGLVVTGGEIVSPSGPVKLKPLQVVRTSLELVRASSSAGYHPLQGTLNPDAFL